MPANLRLMKARLCPRVRLAGSPILVRSFLCASICTLGPNSFLPFIVNVLIMQWLAGPKALP